MLWLVDLFLDPVMVTLLIMTGVSLPIFILASNRRRKAERLEISFATVLRQVSDRLKAGVEVNTALADIVETRSGLTQIIASQLLQRLKTGTNMQTAIEEYSVETESIVLSRISSIIGLSTKAGASLSDVLDRIFEEIWPLYLLSTARREKTKGQSFLIQIGGATFIPIVVGLLFANFARGPVRMATPELMTAIALFTLACAALSTIMSGVISARVKEAMAVTPSYMLLSYAVFQLSMNMFVL